MGDTFPIQPPSMADFYYLGLVVVLIFAAYLFSKQRGNLGLFGNCGLVFFPVYSLAGYLFFLLFKSLGIFTALVGTTCLILFLPFFVMSFSLFFEHGPKRKCFQLPKKAKQFIQPSIYSLLFLGTLFWFLYLVLLSMRT